MEIKANELRIGNLVKRHDDSVFEVTAEDIKILSETDLYLKPLPIPLSEEMLLKVGFESGTDDGNHWWFTKGDIIITYLSWTGKFEWEWQNIEIKNLHQLQNLYFALTGQELNTSGL